MEREALILAAVDLRQRLRAEGRDGDAAVIAVLINAIVMAPPDGSVIVDFLRATDLN